MAADDHRLRHLEADADTTWIALPLRSRKPCEATVKAIAQIDLPRDEQRAERMRQAHAQADAAIEEPHLTLALLSKWHKTACPHARPRTEPWAFAKGGAERYSLDNALLDQRLQDNGPPLTKALRAYLDILFFHPFSDGNSRAARIAFHFLASRHGLQFRVVDPLFRLSIPAGNLRTYALFQQLARRCHAHGKELPSVTL